MPAVEIVDIRFNRFRDSHGKPTCNGCLFSRWFAIESRLGCVWLNEYTLDHVPLKNCPIWNDKKVTLAGCISDNQIIGNGYQIEYVVSRHNTRQHHHEIVVDLGDNYGKVVERAAKRLVDMIENNTAVPVMLIIDNAIVWEIGAPSIGGVDSITRLRILAGDKDQADDVVEPQSKPMDHEEDRIKTRRSIQTIKCGIELALTELAELETTIATSE